MIPSVLSSQIRLGIEDFLRTTFPVSTPFFKDTLENLLKEPEVLFKGPYISIQLPFRQGSAGANYFEGIDLRFPPYLHQERAFHVAATRAKKEVLITSYGDKSSFLE